MDAHVDFHEFVSARWVRLYRLAYLLTTDEAAAEDLQSFGQRILVVPSRDLVIVTQANSPPQRRIGRPATPLSTTRSPPSSPRLQMIDAASYHVQGLERVPARRSPRARGKWRACTLSRLLGLAVCVHQRPRGGSRPQGGALRT